MLIGSPHTEISIPYPTQPTYSSRAWKTLKRPMMWYIFEKEMVWRPQKQCSQVSDTQIHKCKYTNTQIQFGSNYQIDLACDKFLKTRWYEDLKNNVPDCLTPKYTNANTQIHKYTNTVWVKFEDRPNMWHIFEKVMIRGPQKQCSQVSDTQIHKCKYTNTHIHKYSFGQIIR